MTMLEFEEMLARLSMIGYEGWINIEAEGDPATTPPYEVAVKGRKFLRESIGL